VPRRINVYPEALNSHPLTSVVISKEKKMNRRREKSKSDYRGFTTSRRETRAFREEPLKRINAEATESRNRFYFQSSRNDLDAFSQASTFTNCFFRQSSRNKSRDLFYVCSYVIRMLYNMHISIIFCLLNCYRYFFFFFFYDNILIYCTLLIVFLYRTFLLLRAYCTSADSRNDNGTFVAVLSDTMKSHRATLNAARKCHSTYNKYIDRLFLTATYSLQFRYRKQQI